MGIDSSSNSEIPQTSIEYFELLHQKLKTQKTTSPTHPNSPDFPNPQKPPKKWQDVLLKYLTKQEKLGIIWAKDLFNMIKKHKFSSESKFIDLFFWEKFEMKTKPKCLNPNASTSSSISRSRSLDISMSEYQLNKENVKEYIKIFEEHLKSKDHPIAMCIKLFVDVFCKEMKLYLNEVELIVETTSRIERAKVVAEALTQQLVFYLFKLQKCFGIMYSKVLSYKIFEKEKEEFTTLFTSQFFYHKELYDLMIKLFTFTNEGDIIALNEHIDKLNQYDISPNDIGVNEKFRLDRSTEKTQLTFLFKDNVDISDEKLIYLNTYHKKKDYVPYQSSIDLLRNIKDYKTPYEKINLLASISTDVIDNVTKAWKPLEEYLPKNYLSIDGDELILIFSFIVIKADLRDLLAHLYFIKMFTTQDMKSSMIGYYYTTIEASIITVKDVDVEKVKREFSRKTKNGFYYENKEKVDKEINRGDNEDNKEVII